MKQQVIYFSRKQKGSTKTIAEAIASELGVAAEQVTDAQLDSEGLVFLGSGCYGGKPAKKMIQFIEDNSFQSRPVALFGTSGSGEGKEVEEMKTRILAKGAFVKGSFFCKGKFGFINRDHPNDEDMGLARKFARKMIQDFS